ncbi:ABC transporter permease [Amycolatopsis jiangsuensis]|uniref:ABC-type transport system involved in multi-copper enzyme maturation permease subunit n=1 Tax=Amycolatopsis jiangsuensis TaxID=1181879 RepID=A0A840IQM1_9PSEU|nr:ABC transporter permease subunit [Amycolatopsis jiangsuensis]MBB4684123.1 ABC-type transport system involved in multi-copper enzyme maturation permease subunit [Amycolatopsis jiangsuensis]
MIWVAWRQQRAQVIVLLALLVAGYVTVLLLHGSMRADVAALGSCATESSVSGSCGSLGSDFKDSWFDLMKVGEFVVIVLPVLLGMFCAAPLIAREIEHGTHLLAFTQSVGRTRWMLTKFAVTAVPSLLLVLLLQQAVKSWVDSAGKLSPDGYSEFQWTTFGTSGVAPLSYLLFCLSFGMTIGILTRRSLVAMATTLATFIVLRVLLGQSQGLVGTQRLVSDDPTNSPGQPQGAQYVDSGYLTAQGETLDRKAAMAQIAPCGSHTNGTVVPGLTDCYRDHGLAKYFVDVLPVSAAPTVHWVEFAVFTGLAVLSLPVARWALHRRV